MSERQEQTEYGIKKEGKVVQKNNTKIKKEQTAIKATGR
jgi:hypothetical protein